MNPSRQTRIEYCGGCAKRTLGHETSAGIFYCESCWQLAYQRQHAQQQYNMHDNTNNKYKTRNSMRNGDSYRISRSSKRPSTFLPPQNTLNRNDDLKQQLASLRKENMELSAQLNVAMENNAQLRRENKLLNNLGDGIEKYDYMKLKEENHELLDDAERLSLRLKQIASELKKYMQQNNALQTQTQTQHLNIQHIESEKKELYTKYEEEHRFRQLIEEKLSVTKDRHKYEIQKKEKHIQSLQQQIQRKHSNTVQNISKYKNANTYTEHTRHKGAEITPFNVKDKAQIFGSTVKNAGIKRYKKGKIKNDRVYNGSKKNDKMRRDRTGSNGSEHSVESVASIQSNLSLNSGSSYGNNSTLNRNYSSSSKSALNASGYPELSRIPSLQKSAAATSVTVELKKKSLPRNIGMHSREPSDEISEDTDVESLFNSREATPTSAVSTPRTLKAKHKNKRKGKGKSWRTTHEVQRSLSTVKADAFKKVSNDRDELSQLRRGSGGSVRAKRKQIQDNMKKHQFGKKYESSNYIKQHFPSSTFQNV